MQSAGSLGCSFAGDVGTGYDLPHEAKDPTEPGTKTAGWLAGGVDPSRGSGPTAEWPALSDATAGGVNIGKGVVGECSGVAVLRSLEVWLFCTVPPVPGVLTYTEVVLLAMCFADGGPHAGLMALY